MYERTIELISSGSIDVKPLISRIYPFEKSIEAYEAAANPALGLLKVQISL